MDVVDVLEEFSEVASRGSDGHVVAANLLLESRFKQNC